MIENIWGMVIQFIEKIRFIDSNKLKEQFGNLQALCVVIWAFGNTLSLFFLNNRDIKNYGISIEKRLASYKNIISVTFGVCRFFSVALIGLAAISSIGAYWSLLCICTIVQVILAILILLCTSYLIKKTTFERDLSKQLERKLHIKLQDEKIIVNWEKMLFYQVLKNADYDNEDEQTVCNEFCKAGEIIHTKVQELNKSRKEKESIELRIYIFVFENIFFKDEKIEKRWRFIEGVLFQKKQGIKFDLEAVQRAVIYCLVKNTLSIDRRYLRKLLVTTTKPGEWYKWTLALYYFFPEIREKSYQYLWVEQYIENEWVKVEQKAFDIDRYIRRMQRESEILKIVQKLVIESGE